MNGSDIKMKINARAIEGITSSSFLIVYYEMNCENHKLYMSAGVSNFYLGNL